jgi:probable F420-dependent oxidoreductase
MSLRTDGRCMARINLGSVGVWSGVLRNGERSAIVDACAELENLGYSTIWFPGGQHAGLADHVTSILRATRRAAVATGIVSIWTHPAADTARMHAAISDEFPGRFMLGVGVSHQPAVERTGVSYQRPVSKLRSYLDELDAVPRPVPIDERIIAALGPRSLKLARERSSGTHPYFVPVQHTQIARHAVGTDRIVAPEQMVVLETEPGRARRIARQHMNRYLRLPNYTNNLLRLGYAEHDIAEEGSDRLVDDIVAWGDPATVMQRVREHHTAGADHVCVQVLTETPGDLAAAMDGWRQLAAGLPR